MHRLLAPAFAALFATACSAQTVPPIDAQWLRLEVIDADIGSALPQIPHRGEAWVAGIPGRPYALRVHNLSDERLLVVLSVDGVNVVSGETAAADQAGYVLPPWGSADIAGWRKSLDDVATFRFTDLPDSYAARTGRPLDVGVIGAAVFRERPLPPPPPLPLPYPGAPLAEQARDAAANEAPAASASADALGSARAERRPSQAIGTAHGERRWAPTTSTEFERASPTPTEIIALRYDDADGLLARGVLPAARPWVAQQPRPFPGGFAPDP